MAASSPVVFGKLVPKNVVSTYSTSVGSGEELNLSAVAIVCHGKYGKGVFPAVVSKARVPIRGVQDDEPSEADVYPLQKKRKFEKTPESKKQSVARSKRLKVQLHEAGQLAPKRYLTATDSQFASGENVVAGGTSVATNALIAYMFVRRVSHQLGIPLRIYNLKTQNIVCSTDLGYELNPEWIVQEADAQGCEVYYCPEEFIGLSWITYDNGIKIVYVVFSTGKVVATGIKAMEQIPIAEERMHRLIAPFRRGAEPPSFDPDRPRMRDTETLSSIKANLPKSKTEKHAKTNAARRNHRRMLHKLRVTMKQIASVVREETGSEEGADEEMVPFEAYLVGGD